MNNKQHTKNFAQSDDALILDQPVTGIGIKTLATMLHTSEERVMRRADELGVSLAINDVYDAAVDTRTLRLWSRRPASGTAEAGTRRPEVNTSRVPRISVCSHDNALSLHRQSAISVSAIRTSCCALWRSRHRHAIFLSPQARPPPAIGCGLITVMDYPRDDLQSRLFSLTREPKRWSDFKDAVARDLSQ